MSTNKNNKTIENLENVISNPYDNVYWIARKIINSDESAGIGSNSKKMNEVANIIKEIIRTTEKDTDEEELLSTLRKGVRKVLLSGMRKETSTKARVENFCDWLDEQLKTVIDYQIFALTAERIMIPINNSLSNVPNNDKEFVESFALTLLEKKKEEALKTIISFWDERGTKGSLAAERTEIVREFTWLDEFLEKELHKENKESKNIILTAFCQEFERRLLQKRKGRAGGSLESVTSLILDYFNIKTTHAPEHFTAKLEVDRWVKCNDGWIIGISCKRTLRERWKQAYTTDTGMLNRHKIKNIWHVITYDNDLSDEKITEMGSHRVLFYLPEDSPRYKNASKHPGMKTYVRPITSFIQDLKELT